MCKCHRYIDANSDQIIEGECRPEVIAKKTNEYKWDNSAFEQAVGDMVKERPVWYKAKPELVWGSLVNVVWVNDARQLRSSLSFRTADDLVSEVVEQGSWYMSSTESIYTVVLDGLAELGWRPESWVWHQHNGIAGGSLALSKTTA